MLNFCLSPKDDLVKWMRSCLAATDALAKIAFNS